jgi:hypothetical protein
VTGLKAWLWSWKETLHIMIFERELYHDLTKPLEANDFGEVQPPGASND